jgi:hypothetical protein
VIAIDIPIGLADADPRRADLAPAISAVVRRCPASDRYECLSDPDDLDAALSALCRSLTLTLDSSLECAALREETTEERALPHRRPLAPPWI